MTEISAKIASRRTIRDALDAIVRSNATDEAYAVAEAAGYRELFPGCIYKFKETPEMAEIDAATAREIITQAKKDETYAGPIPEDDATCIKEAGDLVDMAAQAWEQYIRGPEVEIILKLAGRSTNGDAPAESDEPAEAPAPAAASAPEPEAAPAAPKPRPRRPPATAPEPEPAAEDVISVPYGLTIADELSKVEPWEGYSEDRVQDITEGINISVTDDPDPAGLLSHIWAYESTHKDRVKILKHVQETWVRVGGDAAVAPDEPETPAEPEAAPAPAEPVDEAPVEPEPEPAPAAEPEVESSTKADDPYKALIQGVDRELSRERLDIPKPPAEDVPDLPWRWAEVADGDLHDFYMQFSSMGYYKSYVASREHRIAMHCRGAADELARTLLLQADKYDEKGKARTITLIEAEVESDEHVKGWRKRQRKHEAFAASAKSEADGYWKMVESLSRLETMRDNAARRSAMK